MTASPAEPPAQPTALGPTHLPTRLARSAGVIGLATTASRLLGLARDLILAFFFGAGNAMDAFNVAFRIPNLLRDLFAEGAMSAAFVPTFTRRLTTRDHEDAWRLGNHVVNALMLATSALVVLGIVFARPLVQLMAGDYALVPGKLDLTVSLTRVMMPFLALIALAAACMGMLNSLRRFFVPALAPAMFNVGTIVGVLALLPLLTAWGVNPIFAAAIGTLLGGGLQAAVQWPLLRREGYRYRPALDPRDPGLHEILILMGPGVLGLAAVQINVFVNTWLATSQGTGAVSWLNYAFRLMYMPIGVFGLSIATAALPTISRHAAREDREAMRGTFSSGLRMMLMLNVPATAGLVALATPIVDLLFRRGRFTPDDTAATAAAVLFYAPGLIGYSAVKLAVPTFYALKESRTPVIVSAMTVGLNIVLNVTLVHVMGYRGLALGTAIAALFNASVLLWLLSRRLGGIDGTRVAMVFGKIAVASAVMAVAAWAGERVLHAAWPGGSTLWRLARLMTVIGFALGVLAVTAKVLRIHEFNEALRTVFARLAGRRQPGSPSL
jgi:putative peptidoglycan lipid II flippase